MIFLDLDGVIADFTGGACAIHGQPDYPVTQWNWYREWGLSGNAFWRPIKEHPDFYGFYVRKYEWADELREQLAILDRVVIATANPLHPGLAASKTQWILDNMGDHFTVQMGNEKELFAGPGRILIDDCDANVEKWRANGGEAVLFPQPWNENADVVDKRLSYVFWCLERARQEKSCD